MAARWRIMTKNVDSSFFQLYTQRQRGEAERESASTWDALLSVCLGRQVRRAGGKGGGGGGHGGVA